MGRPFEHWGGRSSADVAACWRDRGLGQGLDPASILGGVNGLVRAFMYLRPSNLGTEAGVAFCSLPGVAPVAATPLAGFDPFDSLIP